MERLESSDLGRVVISAFILVLLICLIAFTGPDSAPKRTLLRPATPLLLATGLGQGWGVFAPDPRPYQLKLEVEVHNSDGSMDRWRLPFAGPLHANRDYRWRKWMEMNFQNQEGFTQATAVYAARQSAKAGRSPKRVVLIHRYAQLRDIGDDRPLDWKTVKTEFGFEHVKWR